MRDLATDKDPTKMGIPLSHFDDLCQDGKVNMLSFFKKSFNGNFSASKFQHFH